MVLRIILIACMVLSCSNVENSSLQKRKNKGNINQLKRHAYRKCGFQKNAEPYIANDLGDKSEVCLNGELKSLEKTSRWERHIQNPVKHLRWRFLQKLLTTESC